MSNINEILDSISRLKSFNKTYLSTRSLDTIVIDNFIGSYPDDEQKHIIAMVELLTKVNKIDELDIKFANAVLEKIEQ